VIIKNERLLFICPVWYLCRVAVRRTSKPSADRILESSEEVFAEHGYAEVSLRQLMAAAGVSTTAFYARFDSKEAVMAALTTKLFTELYADAPHVLDRARDLETGIVLGVDLLCDRFEPKKSLVRMILAETGASKAAVDARRRAYTLLATFLGARLKVLAERKRIDTRDPEALAWALVGALEMQVTRWAVWNEIDTPTLRKQLVAAAKAILPEETGKRS
jgi:AcrR family transcriptional regulator